MSDAGFYIFSGRDLAPGAHIGYLTTEQAHELIDALEQFDLTDLANFFKDAFGFNDVGSDD